MGKALTIGIGTRLRGRFFPMVVNREGRVVRRYPMVENIIVDAGLNRIATTTYEACMRYCIAGTGTTTPTSTDTILSAQVLGDAGHADTYLQNTSGANGTTLSGDTFTHVRTYDFDYPSISTVYKEAGVTWNSSPYTVSFTPIFNHVLLNGATGIVVDSSERLRITYELDITVSPITATAKGTIITIPGPFTIGGNFTLEYFSNTAYMPLWSIQETGAQESFGYGSANLEPSLINDSGGNRDLLFWVSDTDKSLPGTDPWNVVYNASDHHWGQNVGGSSASITTIAAVLGSYSSGSFTRSKTGTFTTGSTLSNRRVIGAGTEGAGNTASESYTDYCGIAAVLDSVFTKSTSQQLVLTLAYTWDRA